MESPATTDQAARGESTAASAFRSMLGGAVDKLMPRDLQPAWERGVQLITQLQAIRLNPLAVTAGELDARLGQAARRLMRPGKNPGLSALFPVVSAAWPAGQHHSQELEDELAELLLDAWHTCEKMIPEGELVVVEPSFGGMSFDCAVDDTLLVALAPQGEERLVRLIDAARQEVQELSEALAYQDVLVMWPAAGRTRRVKLSRLISEFESLGAQALEPQSPPPSGLSLRDFDAALRGLDPRRPSPVLALQVINSRTKELKRALQHQEDEQLQHEQRYLYTLKARAAQALLDSGELRYCRTETVGSTRYHLLIGSSELGDRGFHLPVDDIDLRGRQPQQQRAGSQLKTREATALRKHFSMEGAMSVLLERIAGG